jgi:hypothetical protein
MKNEKLYASLKINKNVLVAGQHLAPRRNIHKNKK